MGINYVFYLYFLFQFGAVKSEEVSNYTKYDFTEASNQCASYCLKALKPLIDNSVHTQNNINKCYVDIRNKDDQIVKLEKKLTECQDDRIAELKQKTCHSKDSEILIASLKTQIEEISAVVKVLKTQLSTLNDSIILQKEKHRIAENASNCVPFENSTGIHKIQVPDIGSISVLCDNQTAGNGWTVIQRRFGGSENFYRSWSEYRNGFGNLSGEFILGLETLHHMTSSLPYELHIELTDFSGNVRHARYDNFRIGSEKEQFMLMSLGTYSGTAGDALTYNLHDKFTTYDRDNDAWDKGNCAKYYASGGWYNLHGNSNLNGKYLNSEVNSVESIWWFNWKSYNALKSVKMMIRPKYSLI